MVLLEQRNASIKIRTYEEVNGKNRAENHLCANLPVQAKGDDSGEIFTACIRMSKSIPRVKTAGFQFAFFCSRSACAGQGEDLLILYKRR